MICSGSCFLKKSMYLRKFSVLPWNVSWPKSNAYIDFSGAVLIPNTPPKLLPPGRHEILKIKIENMKILKTKFILSWKLLSDKQLLTEPQEIFLFCFFQPVNFYFNFITQEAFPGSRRSVGFQIFSYLQSTPRQEEHLVYYLKS